MSNSTPSKIALVTGASRGLGRNTALALARSGSDLIATYHSNRAEADSLVAEVEALGRRIAVFQLDTGDVSSFESFAGQVKSTLAQWGRERFDHLVNNAGYGTRGPVELVPVDLIRRNFETNVFALIALTQLVAPHMRERGSGRIVNIGSVAGRIARPMSSVYDSTKHALEALTEHEVPHGLAVAWGIDLVNHVAWKRGLLRNEALLREVHEFIRCHLPFKLSRRIDAAQLIDYARHDKKVVNGQINLAVMEKPGVLKIVKMPFDEELRTQISEYLEEHNAFDCD